MMELIYPGVHAGTGTSIRFWTCVTPNVTHSSKLRFQFSTTFLPTAPKVETLKMRSPKGDPTDGNCLFVVYING